MAHAVSSVTKERSQCMRIEAEKLRSAGCILGFSKAYRSQLTSLVYIHVGDEEPHGLARGTVKELIAWANEMQLNTPRLILRDFKPTDGVAFAATRSLQSHVWHCEADVTAARSIELVELFVQWSLEDPRRRFQLALVERSANRLIGTLGVRCHCERETEADFGCELADFARGRGYAEEAAKALLDWSFNALPLTRIVAQTLAGNLAARQLAERLGFVAEGPAPGQLLENEWQSGLFLALERLAYLKPVKP